MRKTPQRLRSFAPPTRDKIILWSAVTAGCGILALLCRSVAISRFSTDEFTGNVLFVVFFMLLIGLYLIVQTSLEGLFDRIFKKNAPSPILETASVEPISIESSDEKNPEESVMEYSAPAEEGFCDVAEDEVEFAYDDQDDEEREKEMLEEAYQDYLNSLTPQQRYDHEHGITRVSIVPETDPNEGCFATHPACRIFHNEDGTTLIEEWEESVYLTANGNVYSNTNLDKIIDFYEKHKDKQDILEHHDICAAAHEELEAEEKKYSLTQIAFICAYITHSLKSHIEADQLKLLHKNAERWTTNAVAPLTPVKLRPGHRLSTDDLKHLAYNIGKFLKLNGKVIARFVKVVFPDDFSTLGFGTIEAKLCVRDPDKDTIPIYMNNEMEILFDNFKKKDRIDLKVLDTTNDKE